MLNFQRSQGAVPPSDPGAPSLSALPVAHIQTPKRIHDESETYGLSVTFIGDASAVTRVDYYEAENYDGQGYWDEGFQHMPGGAGALVGTSSTGPSYAVTGLASGSFPANRPRCFVARIFYGGTDYSATMNVQALWFGNNRIYADADAVTNGTGAAGSPVDSMGNANALIPENGPSTAVVMRGQFNNGTTSHSIKSHNVCFIVDDGQTSSIVMDDYVAAGPTPVGIFPGIAENVGAQPPDEYVIVRGLSCIGIEIRGGFYGFKSDNSYPLVVDCHIHQQGGDCIKLAGSEATGSTQFNACHHARILNSLIYDSRWNEQISNGQGIDMVGGDYTLYAYNVVQDVNDISMKAKGSSQFAVMRNNLTMNCRNGPSAGPGTDVGFFDPNDSVFGGHVNFETRDMEVFNNINVPHDSPLKAYLLQTRVPGTQLANRASGFTMNASLRPMSKFNTWIGDNVTERALVFFDDPSGGATGVETLLPEVEDNIGTLNGSDSYLIEVRAPVDQAAQYHGLGTNGNIFHVLNHQQGSNLIFLDQDADPDVLASTYAQWVAAGYATDTGPDANIIADPLLDSELRPSNVSPAANATPADSRVTHDFFNHPRGSGTTSKGAIIAAVV